MLKQNLLKYNLKKSIFIIAFLSMNVYSQNLPPIQKFKPKNFSIENQNWAISQSTNKNIYVANNKGLLEYNSEDWILYPSPNETIIRSVNVIDDVIYTGCYMDFGYWVKNEFGKLTYTSLLNKLKLPLIEDEQFWNILQLDNWVIFQSLNRMIIYQRKNATYTIVNSNTTLTKTFKVKNSIYYQKLNDGIYKIEKGNEVLITDDRIVKENIVTNIFNKDENLLIETQEKGFYTLVNNKLSLWKIPANKTLLNSSIYSSVQLDNGTFILGTISNGIIQLSKDGKIINVINQSKGLSNNTVLSIFKDVDNNIWLGLDSGINYISLNSPFSIYNDAAGEIGKVYASAIHKGNLYLGTNQGLFYKKNNSNDKFKFIKNTKGQVWCLKKINKTLFCGHNSGTFIIDNNKAIKIAKEQGTWNIEPVLNKNNLLIQGNYNGLHILEKVKGKWKYRNKIEGLDISSRFFEWINENELFINHEYKGVFKIKLDNGLRKALKITKEQSVLKGKNSSLFTYKNNLYYCYKKGVFKYIRLKKTFVKDTIFSQFFNVKDYSSGRIIVDKTNKVWSFTKNGLNYFTTSKLSKVPEIKKITLPNSMINGILGYENIMHLDKERYIFGTTTGYVIINLDKVKNRKYNVFINAINNHKINTDINQVDITKTGKFLNKENNITFRYNIVEYDKFTNVLYQTKLEGFNDKWSNWDKENETKYNNLPYGEYTFLVKAKGGSNVSNNIEKYNFEIEKPWYLSNLMLFLYVISFILLYTFIHHMYKQYYKKQREQILEENNKKLKLNQLESKQQLMAIENEKLQQDIESKDREVAISIMSLIKKNEFLNSIKKELKNVNQSKEIKAVIKMIDRNINNTDDWKFFQEAFNNVDKDFFKKIKNLHPSLTPNDLKLCAYLRLNLSSKEIAPLLNISPRSVEVKRYRLRKKMNLPHKYSLTSYILDI